MTRYQIGAAVVIALLLGVASWWEGRQDERGKGDGWLLAVVVGLLVLGAVLALFVLGEAHARDLGQWGNTDPVVSNWYKNLMRPDVPTSSCCGEADAYWADEIHVRDGKTYAVITDDRDDKPLGRPHIPNGTEVEIPDVKMKWDQGNPTGHSILFLSGSRYVFCFVQGTGI